MSQLDPIPYDIGHAAETRAMRERLARVLAAHWDPSGALAHVLAARRSGARCAASSARATCPPSTTDGARRRLTTDGD